MKEASAEGDQGEAGAGSPPLLPADDAAASGPAVQGGLQRRTTDAGLQRAVSNSEPQGTGRGAKPSCGLVHLNKAFIELHFAGQGLPQTVWVQVNVDGRDFSVRLPGQVYSTSCGQDHWLLGLQYVFKVHKEPLISRVEMGADRTLRVTITSRGRQDKFASPNTSQGEEQLRALEAAAVKAAETAVMKRQGRVQVTGPNINVPKKQLRAQWPALLTACAPTEVTAHIWLDDSDSYISCPAKIILTKAKAEPVFYLAGLSSLLKNYTGAYATLELVAEQQLVRVHLDTNTKHLHAALGGAGASSSSALGAGAAAGTLPAPAAAGAVGAGSSERGADDPLAVAAAGDDVGMSAQPAGHPYQLQQQQQQQQQQRRQDAVAVAAKPVVHAGVPIAAEAAGLGAAAAAAAGARTPPLLPGQGPLTLSGGAPRTDLAPSRGLSARPQPPGPPPQQQQQQRLSAFTGASGSVGGMPLGPAPASWPIAAATAAGAAPPAAAAAWRAPLGYAAAEAGVTGGVGDQLGWSRKRPYAPEALHPAAAPMDWSGPELQLQQQQRTQMVMSPRLASMDPHAHHMVPAHLQQLPGQHLALAADGYLAQGWPHPGSMGPPAYACHAAPVEEALEQQALHYQQQQWQKAYEPEVHRRGAAAGPTHDGHFQPHMGAPQYAYMRHEHYHHQDHQQQQQQQDVAGWAACGGHLQPPSLLAVPPGSMSAAAAAGAGTAAAAELDLLCSPLRPALRAGTPQLLGDAMDRPGEAPSSSRGKPTAAAAGGGGKSGRAAMPANSSPLLPRSTAPTNGAGKARTVGRRKSAGTEARNMAPPPPPPAAAAAAAAAAVLPLSAEVAAQLSYHHRGLSQDGLNLLATHALLELANDGGLPGAAAGAGAGAGMLAADGVGPVLKKRRLARSRITCPARLQQQLRLLTVGLAEGAPDTRDQGAAAGWAGDVDMAPVGVSPALGTSPPAAAGAAAGAGVLGGGDCGDVAIRLPRVSSPDEVTTGFHLVGNGAKGSDPAAADTPTARGSSGRRLSEKDTQQWRDQHQQQQDNLPAVVGSKAAAGGSPPTPDTHVHFPMSPMASGSGRRTSTTSSAAAAAAAAAGAAAGVGYGAAGMQHGMATSVAATSMQLGHQNHRSGPLVRDTPQSSDTGSTLDDPATLAAATAGAGGAEAAAANGRGQPSEQETVCSSRPAGVARQLLPPSLCEGLQPQQEAYWRRRAAAAVAAASRRAAAMGGSTSREGVAAAGPFEGVVHSLEKVSLQQPALPALFMAKHGCSSFMGPAAGGGVSSPSFAAGGSASGRLEMTSSYPLAAVGGGGSSSRGGHAGGRTGPLYGAGGSAPLPSTRTSAAATAAASGGGAHHRRARPTPLELPGTPPGWAAGAPPPGLPCMGMPGAPRGGYGHPGDYPSMPATPAVYATPWSILDEDPYAAAGGAAAGWALASADPALAAAALKHQIDACLAAPPVVGRVSEERRRRYYEAAATAASIQTLCAVRAQQRPALPPYPLQHSAAQVTAPGDDGCRPHQAVAGMGMYSSHVPMAAGAEGMGVPHALSSSRAGGWVAEQQQRQMGHHGTAPWYASSEGGWSQQVAAHGAVAHLTRLPHPGAAAAAMAAAAAAGGPTHTLAAAVTRPPAGGGGGDGDMGSGLPNQASDRASVAVAGVPPLLEQKSSGPSSAAPGACQPQGTAAAAAAGGEVGRTAPYGGMSSCAAGGVRQADGFLALPPAAWGEPGGGYGAVYFEDPADAAAASAWAAGILSSASPKCPHARRRRMLLMQEARLLATSYSGHAASEPAHQQLGCYSGQQPSGGGHTSPAWLEQRPLMGTAAAGSGGLGSGMQQASGAGGDPASEAAHQLLLQQQGSEQRPAPPDSSCSMGGLGATSGKGYQAHATALSPTPGAPGAGASPDTAAAGALQDAGGGEVLDESGWPLLPDAANLVEVGRALVTVMNFLNAPSSDRLALTRTLRTMTPPDREWLLSFTYPYLQDACARRALPELQGVMRDILSGAHAATAEAAVAGDGATAPGV